MNGIWEGEAPAEPSKIESFPFLAAQQELRPPEMRVKTIHRAEPRDFDDSQEIKIQRPPLCWPKTRAGHWHGWG